MYGINAKLPKTQFKCEMCHRTQVQDRYVWGNFALPPKHKYKEHTICKKCAIREHGSKNKRKLEDIIDERTERWLKNQKLNQNK
jgi:hypothetical protein